MKFECELIPLYKFTAKFEGKDGNSDWKWVVVSDTLYGVADKIIERCIVDGDNDLKTCRKELYVTDFIKMQCSGLKSGFHLLDIDEYDCCGYGSASIDEQYVETSFGISPPMPVISELITEDMLEEAYLRHAEPDTPIPDYYFMSDALGEAIYEIAVSSRLFMKKKQESLESKERESYVAKKRIREITLKSLL